MLTGLITLIIVIAVLVALGYLVDYINTPAPFNMIAKVVLGLIGVLYVLHFFGIY